MTAECWAIDPGTDKSGWAIMQGKDIVKFGTSDNFDLLNDIATSETVRPMYYEMVACYGMPVGAEVFETCLWIGRFIQAHDGFSVPVYRREVKSYLCHSMKATDATIRRSILDMYPRTGGGKTPQKGTKAKPGPLYGVSSHVFSAIAVGLTGQKAR